MSSRIESLVVVIGSLITIHAWQPKAPAVAPPMPPAVIFAALAGGASPAPQTVPIASGAVMQLTSAPPSWLTVTVSNQGPQSTATVNVNLASAPAGISHASIDFTSADKKI